MILNLESEIWNLWGVPRSATEALAMPRGRAFGTRQSAAHSISDSNAVPQSLAGRSLTYIGLILNVYFFYI
jgi:hypothetical protein